MKKIAIVTPCFNEEENIGPFFDRLSKVLARHDQYAFQLI
ncbi:glycosyltransferase, partial [Clostridium perfringens]